MNVDTTLAGRAFRLVEIIPAEDEQVTLWMPLLDGTERLGVAGIGLPANADPRDAWLREQCWVLAGLIGHLVAGKLPYSDRFHLVRRTRPMSMAAELLWHLLPPQTFACPGGGHRGDGAVPPGGRGRLRLRRGRRPGSPGRIRCRGP